MLKFIMYKKIPNILKNNYHYLTFGVFMLIHSLITFFTTYFGDDYYYAAFVRNGSNYFIDENILHYETVNGRALVHLLDELLIGWSFIPWRIFNILCVGALVILVAKLAAKTYKPCTDENEANEIRENYKRALVISCAIFAATGLPILRQSIYWATGMMNYLFPAVLTLFFYYLFRRDFETLKGSWSLIPIALFASATTEQASAAAFLVACCFIVSCIVVKRRAPKPSYIGSLIASIVGMCTLFLAPGNSVRMEYYPDFYSLSLIGKIGTNLKTLSATILNRNGLCAIIVLLYIVILHAAYKYYREGKRPILSLILLGITSFDLGVYIYAINSNSELFLNIFFDMLIVLPILAAMIYTAVRYFTRGEIDELYFVWCTLAVQGAMLLSPIYGPRTLTISLVTAMVVLTSRILKHKEAAMYILIAVCAFALLPNVRISFPVLAVVFALVFISGVMITKKPDAKQLASIAAVAICLAQFSTVASGYASNLEVHQMNRENIREFTQNGGDYLVLYYLPYHEYKYTMPYDDPYHRVVLLKLCGIDPNTQVYYEFLPNYEYE